MTVQLAKLEPGTEVLLKFYTGGVVYSTEPTKFLGLTEEGNAKFFTQQGKYPAYEWEAYRFNDRWSYGTSADRVTVVRVIKG